jgi:hypothetical protein
MGIPLSYIRLTIGDSPEEETEVPRTVFFAETDGENLRIVESDFTGIGTREPSHEAKEAINSLFMRSFRL